MEEKLPHTPEICVYYKRNRCKHGISGKVPVGRSKECEAIHPQLCWQFLKHGPGKLGCAKGAKCGYLHPFICQQLWKTGSCEKGNRCGDGYHLGGDLDKCKVETYCRILNGLTGNLITFYARHNGEKHKRQESGSIQRSVLETNKTTTGERGCSKITTTGVDRLANKIPKGQQQLEDQVRETNSPRERPKPWTRVKAI